MIKRRDKKSPRQPKTVRNTIIGGLGLGSTKEESTNNHNDEGACVYFDIFVLYFVTYELNISSIVPGGH